MPIFECSQCNEMTYSAFPGATGPCAQCGSERHRVVDGHFDEARRADRELGAGDHAVLVHDDPEGAAPFCARFLGDGIQAGERVLAGTPDDLRRAIAAELPGEVERAIEWQPPSAFYSDFDAERVASTYEAVVLAEPRTTRLLAGLDRGCAEDVDPAELTRYEAIAHSIITRLGANVLCVYDASALPAELIEVANRRHGLAVERDSVRRNERFEYEPV